MTNPYSPSKWVVDPSMDDIDVFPILPGQSFLSKKDPLWATDVKVSVSGRERRRKMWSYPRWQFSVSYEVLRSSPTYTEMQRMWAFFNSKSGRYSEFFFYDPSDNEVVNESFGTGDSTTTGFRLTKSTAFAGTKFSEPVGGFTRDPVVRIDGVITTDFTLGAYGFIEFDTAPGTGAKLTWDGGFVYLCRFDQDEFNVMQMVSNMWSSDGVSFLTVKI